ncbi:hypothetical protein [Vulcanisaeta sp. JCM 16161]|uniref:hypothetical protein n=1 Tax=Vulcanisaeta sp. JCM 16161 TaxID=1295372 RepID=UPI00406CBD47
MGSLAEIIEELMKYTSLFLIASIVGLFIACLLNEGGFMRRIDGVIKALFKPVGLPTFLAPAVISAMVNAYRAEHMIIYDYYTKGYLSDDGIILYVLVSGYLRGFGALLHVGPIVLVALGPMLGAEYLALLYIRYVLFSIMGLIYGRIKRISIEARGYTGSMNSGRITHLSHICLIRSVKVTLRVLPRFMVIIAIVLTLELVKAFTLLTGYMVEVIGPLSTLLSPAAITVLVTAIASPSSAYFVGSSLLSKGLLSTKILLISLLLGSMVGGLTIGLTRHSLPFYLSIYPPRLAVRIALIQAIADAVSIMLITIIIIIT